MKCQAHSRDGTGKPCGKHALKGATVCASHGGSAPQVRAAAMQRLLAAADPVAAELVRLATKSEDEKVRLAACRDLLDRVAVSSPKQIEVLPDPTLVKSWIDALEADLAEHDDADAR